MSHCPECARLTSELAEARGWLARYHAIERSEVIPVLRALDQSGKECARLESEIREEREQSDALRSTLNEEREARLKFGADVDDLRLLVSDLEEQIHAANESHAVVLGKLAASEAALADEKETHAAEEATFATELADALRMLREERAGFRDLLQQFIDQNPRYSATPLLHANLGRALRCESPPPEVCSTCGGKMGPCRTCGSHVCNGTGYAPPAVIGPATGEE